MKDKILFFSDAHIREVGSFLPWAKVVNGHGLTGELVNIKKSFTFIRSLILETQPRLVLFGGDWHHTTDFVTALTLHVSSICHSMIVSACKEVGCEFWMFRGQHDLFSEQFNICSINIFANACTVIPSEKIKDIDGFKIGILPYVSCKELAISTLSEMSCKVDLLSTHLDFAGCSYETGKKSESVIPAKLGVPCLAGDQHLKQKVKDVRYCGSLYQNRFNREDTEKAGGAILFDMNTKKMKFYKNTLAKHYVKVSDLENVKNLNPDECVLQVSTDNDRQEVEEVCSEFEHIFFPRPLFKNDVEFQEEYVDTTIKEPKVLLRDYIKEDNPSAVEVYDKVIGKK